MKSFMIVLVGASGSGKSHLRNYICNYTEIKVSKLLAITDRTPRLKEKNGIDKIFVNTDFFSKTNELCLINNVYGFTYAFSKDDFCSGKTFLAEMHYKNLSDFLSYHKNTVTIYIKTESYSSNEKSINARILNENENITRLEHLQKDIDYLEEMYSLCFFDYVFINNFDSKSEKRFEEMIINIIEGNRLCND